MLEIVMSNKFKKDLKLASKRGYNLNLLDKVVESLAKQKNLPFKNHDHELTGNYVGFRKCHIQPDWLLVYRIHEENFILFLARTGIHSDLFN